MIYHFQNILVQSIHLIRSVKLYLLSMHFFAALCDASAKIDELLFSESIGCMSISVNIFMRSCHVQENGKISLCCTKELAVVLFVVSIATPYEKSTDTVSLSTETMMLSIITNKYHVCHVVEATPRVRRMFYYSAETMSEFIRFDLNITHITGNMRQNCLVPYRRRKIGFFR